MHLDEFVCLKAEAVTPLDTQPSRFAQAVIRIQRTMIPEENVDFPHFFFLHALFETSSQLHCDVSMSRSRAGHKVEQTRSTDSSRT